MEFGDTQAALLVSQQQGAGESQMSRVEREIMLLQPVHHGGRFAPAQRIAEFGEEPGLGIAKTELRFGGLESSQRSLRNEPAEFVA